MANNEAPQTPPPGKQPMGDTITLPNGTQVNVPFTGMTAARAAALVAKHIG